MPDTLTPRTARQLRSLGRLAAYLHDNPHLHPLDAIAAHYGLSTLDRTIMQQGYDERSDPIDTVI